MQGENDERWRKLSEQAVVERDHERLMQLIQGERPHCWLG